MSSETEDKLIQAVLQELGDVPEVAAPVVGERGAPGQQGEQGPPGEPGEVGPMPAHRWDGTKLQFEQAPGGEWGSAVDLQGPQGEPGMVVGAATLASTSYFPGGW